MTRIRRANALIPSQHSAAKLRKPTSKELDLLLLAGCSCLMTVLYHPVAEALQTPQLGGTTNSAIATQTAKTTTHNSMNAFHLVLPATREEITEEEDA
jgi:hypothetical protein